MVPIRDLDDDYYEFDEKNYCLIGRRKKHVYQLGDKLTVQVARADLNKKQLDFAIVGNEADKKAAATSVNKEGDVVSTAKSLRKIRLAKGLEEIKEIKIKTTSYA